MATGHIDLFPGGIAPDGSGSGNVPAALSYEVSAAVQGSNSPKVTQLKLLFDAAADEHWLFAGVLPNNWSSGLTLRGKVKFTSATTGNAMLKAAVVFSTDGSTDDDALAFGAADVSAAVAAPATQGQTAEFSIALTLSGAAARRKFVLMIGRDADHASDDAAGDLELLDAWLEYTMA